MTESLVLEQQPEGAVPEPAPEPAGAVEQSLSELEEREAALREQEQLASKLELMAEVS